MLINFTQTHILFLVDKVGLGIEENIFTACIDCHTAQENGLNTLEYEKEAENYLKSKYQNWNKSNLIYKKY